MSSEKYGRPIKVSEDMEAFMRGAEVLGRIQHRLQHAVALEMVAVLEADIFDQPRPATPVSDALAEAYKDVPFEDDEEDW